MHAEDLVRQGNLGNALQELQTQIRSQPENREFRTFLFQLLAVMGQWDRALNQLNVLTDLDAGFVPMLHIWKAAIQCEAVRREILEGGRAPLLLGEPPAWMAGLLESLRLMGQGRYDLALSLRNEAFEQAAESTGKINDQPFAWIADAESRLGPVLEVILKGQYYWAPFEQIKMITTEGPKDLRDLVWLPARFIWANGGEAYGFIPTRYVGSESSQDSSIQLARRTEWRQLAENVYQGLGQRVLVTNQEEYPLLEVRSIEID
jgi:type VI secretion system protein ImpE